MRLTDNYANKQRAFRLQIPYFGSLTTRKIKVTLYLLHEQYKAACSQSGPLTGESHDEFQPLPGALVHHAPGARLLPLSGPKASTSVLGEDGSPLAVLFTDRFFGGEVQVTSTVDSQLFSVQARSLACSGRT